MRKRKSSNSLWIVTLGLVAILVISLWYLAHSNPKPAASSAAPAKAAAKAPQFEFYNMLPNKESAKTTQTPASTPTAKSSNPAAIQPVLAPAAQIPAPLNEKAQKKSAAPTSIQYLVALPPSKDFATADQLKASLTLNGFTVHMGKTTVNKTVIYRLSTGPYPNLKAAQAAQKQLQQNQIKSTLVKVPLKKSGNTPK